MYCYLRRLEILISLLLEFGINFLHLQPLLKRRPGDADHISDTDRFEQSRVRQLISRGAANAQNGCDIAYSVCSALCGLLFFRSIVVHNNFLSVC